MKNLISSSVIGMLVSAFCLSAHSKNNEKQIKIQNFWNPISIYGTNSSNESITENLKNKFLTLTKKKLVQTDWSSENNHEARIEGAYLVAESILSQYTFKDHLLLYGHSHGGNVAVMAINLLIEKFGFDPEKIILVTLNTPVLKVYQLIKKVKKHINIYNPQDIIQVRAGQNNEIECFILEGCAERTFRTALNLPYVDALEESYWYSIPFTNRIATHYNPFDCSNRHCGNDDVNINKWFPEFSWAIKFL